MACGLIVDRIRDQDQVLVRESFFGMVAMKAGIHLQSVGLPQNTIREAESRSSI